MHPIKYLSWRLLFYAVISVVLVLALVPSNTSLPTTGWDKSNHFLAFGVLAFLAHKSYKPNFYTLFFGLFIYGGTIELLQSLTPTRSGEITDLIADSVGILIGYGICRFSNK